MNLNLPAFYSVAISQATSWTTLALTHFYCCFYPSGFLCYFLPIDKCIVLMLQCIEHFQDLSLGRPTRSRNYFRFH